MPAELTSRAFGRSLLRPGGADRLHRRAGAAGGHRLGGHPGRRARHAGDGAALAVRLGLRTARGATDRGQRSRARRRRRVSRPFCGRRARLPHPLCPHTPRVGGRHLRPRRGQRRRPARARTTPTRPPPPRAPWSRRARWGSAPERPSARSRTAGMMKGGIGMATVRRSADGVTVTALTVVNALGDVLDEQGSILAGRASRRAVRRQQGGCCSGMTAAPDCSRPREHDPLGRHDRRRDSTSCSAASSRG